MNIYNIYKITRFKNILEIQKKTPIPTPPPKKKHEKNTIKTKHLFHTCISDYKLNSILYNDLKILCLSLLSRKYIYMNSSINKQYCNILHNTK